MGQEARGRARIDSGGFPIPHCAHVLKIALVHLSKIEKKRPFLHRKSLGPRYSIKSGMTVVVNVTPYMGECGNLVSSCCRYDGDPGAEASLHTVGGINLMAMLYNIAVLVS